MSDKVSWAVVGLFIGKGREKDNPEDVECVMSGFATMGEAYDAIEASKHSFLAGEEKDGGCNRFQEMWVESYRGNFWSFE